MVAFYEDGLRKFLFTNLRPSYALLPCIADDFDVRSIKVYRR